MTAPTAAPASAEDLVSAPAGATPADAGAAVQAARAARRTARLAAPAADPPAGAREDPPATRKGGHKATKAELVDEVARLRSQLSAVAGEEDPEQLQRVGLLRGALAMTFSALGQVIAARRGPHWKFSPDETEQLGNAWAPVVAPYVGAVGTYLPWLSAAAVTYAVVEKRVAIDIARAGDEIVVDQASAPQQAAK